MEIATNLLPKVELHCHLLGVIGPSLLRKLAANHSVLIDFEKLAEIYPVLGPEGFTNWLRMTMPYQTASLDILLEVLRIHIDDLIEQNVIYTELMISPTMFPASTDQQLKAFDFLKKQVAKWERNQIQIEFNMVIPRTLPDHKIKQDVANFIELFKAGFIVGVALVGLEINQSIKRFAPYFSKLKEAGLGIEIHAGEHSGPCSVKEAISFGLADRIGHGISAFHEPALVNQLVAYKTHIEFCITSNISTGSVETLMKHPIVRARELGMNFSVNTDDPGIFDCTLNSEYQLLSENLGFNKLDFDRIYHQSLTARFSKELRYQ